MVNVSKKKSAALTTLPAEISPTLFAELTPREQAFVNHPLILTNAYQAAVAVGYSESTARTKAAQMRKQLMYYIRPVVKQRMAEQGISLERVEQELGYLAFANEADFYEKVDIENDTILVAKDPMLLPENMQRAIRSIDISETILSDGGRIQNVSIQLHEKAPALKMLAEMLGGFDPRSREPGDAAARRSQAELFDFMSADDLKTVTEIYARAESNRTKSLKSKLADKEAIDGKAEPIV